MISLEAENLSVSFPRRGGGRTLALDQVSLSLAPGGALGVIGESGSGKSTLARVLMGLQRPDQGQVRLGGREMRTDCRPQRRRMQRVQMIFQDATGALNPRQTVGTTLTEALRVHGHLAAGGGETVRQQLAERLRQVGLAEAVRSQYPHELSGGQAQRVCIARALATDPAILIADEPVSALDVSVQARILRLLDSLRRERGLSLLLIAHDLAVVGALCEQVMVMHQGHILEQGTPQTLYRTPRHPYTQRLLAAVPDVERELEKSPPPGITS